MNILYRPLLFLAACLSAELVTDVEETAGIVIYFVTLFLIIIHSSIPKKAADQRFLLTLGLIPLMRITNLAIPLGEISEIYWYIIIAVPMLAGILAVMRVLDLNPSDVGLTRANVPYWQIFLLATAGLGFGVIDYFILEPDSLITSLTFGEILVPALILLVTTGIVEELVFRGVMQHTAQAMWQWGWIYIAILYAVLQLGHGSALHCLFALVVMLLFGWIVKKTGSIVGVSLSHGMVNIGLYLVWPHVF